LKKKYQQVVDEKLKLEEELAVFRKRERRVVAGSLMAPCSRRSWSNNALLLQTIARVQQTRGGLDSQGGPALSVRQSRASVDWLWGHD
jgi:hypothetical protein